MAAFESWSNTRRDGKKLLPFKRRVLRKIYGPIRNINVEDEKKTQQQIKHWKVFQGETIGVE